MSMLERLLRDSELIRFFIAHVQYVQLYMWWDVLYSIWNQFKLHFANKVIMHALCMI